MFHECHIIGQWWFVGIVSFSALIQYRSMYKPVRSSAVLQGGVTKGKGDRGQGVLMLWHV